MYRLQLLLSCFEARLYTTPYRVHTVVYNCTRAEFSSMPRSASLHLEASIAAYRYDFVALLEILYRLSSSCLGLAA